MIELDKYFHLFSCCLPVKGSCRSAIVDLQRHQFHCIPNELYAIVTESNSATVKETTDRLKECDRQVVLEYFDYLIEQDLGVLLKSYEIELFPKLNLQWDFPSEISNAVVEISSCFGEYIKKIITQIDTLNCFFIQFIFYKPVTRQELGKILEMCNCTSVRSIQLNMPFSSLAGESDYIALCKGFHKIAKIECFDSPIDKVENVYGEIGKIIYYSKTIQSSRSCGVVDIAYFPNNISHFTESQHHNTCLNRKVCIDINGDIKNCPAMSRSFGNIRDTSIAQAIAKPGFKDLWNIRKDDIEVCKDCEFRHMCTDCRAFIKEPNNIYSQPAKCTYNPYIAKWQGEEGYISIEDMTARE
ncbi:MAG: grasp-with-spasm system SPASM domain peptide maturase [Bacteroidota bacterium]